MKQPQNIACKDRWRLHNLKDQTKIDELITSSQTWVNTRQSLIPRITYPHLPVQERVEDIKQALQDHQVVIVAGETGSGKSTQLPKICLDMGLGARGLIGHTQPRRLAARSVANRVAEEIGTQVGDQVGFKIRFNDHTNERTLIKVMTDGILLAEIQNDKFLSQYEVIIIDEAHERSLTIDFLLGHLKLILAKRPDLKVIITSATIDHQRFVEHFNYAKLIEVSGRTYPVEVRYHEDLSGELSQSERILRAIDELGHEKAGDVLVFLATEKEIHDNLDFLNKAQLRHTEVIPLYGRLSNADQQKIFQPSGKGRRIILSTNVAETSLTVPGIRYVIDCGEVRISRYNHRTKVQCLPIEAISQASANQRAGRCGRVAAGICIRLYSQDDFLSRPEYTDPEIRRTNLAAVILQMLVMRLGNIEKFPFIDKPDQMMINDGYKLLHEINAIQQLKHHHIDITPLGKTIARLPLDPKLATMLVHAVKHGALSEIAIIVSFLSIQDPRERPLQFQQKADQAHQQDHDEQSDFITIVNLWKRLNQAFEGASNKQKRDYFKRNFISPLRWREWQEIYTQIQQVAKSLQWRYNQEPATYQAIHQSILAGLLGNIGFNHDAKEYMGARGLKFHIFPGSSQFKRTPKWMCSAELVETTRRYARVVATIKPEWIEPLADHLVKRHYSEPHWRKKRGAVVALERVSLYGLDIVAKRIVNYDNIDPIISREIFIREALVNGDFDTQAPFFKANLALLDEVEGLEHKSRRRDIVVDEETLYQYYDKIIPEDVFSKVSLEQWHKQLSAKDRQVLYFDKESLMQHQANEITNHAYPDYFSLGSMQLPLRYHFDPSAEDDGVTIRVPLVLIDQFNAQATEWLVPGMLEEKVVAMMRGLPKNIRKACVPVPYYAQAVMQSIEYDTSTHFTAQLCRELVRITGISFDVDVWSELNLSAHLLMRFEVIDEKGNILASGRDFYTIKDQLAGVERPTVEMKANADDTVYQTWDFNELAETTQVVQHGLQMTVYPCLIAVEEGVQLSVKPSYYEAKMGTREGILKLLQIACRHIDKTMIVQFEPKGQFNLLFTLLKAQKWQKFLVDKAYRVAFHLEDEDLPRTQAQFTQRLEAYRSDLADVAKHVSGLMLKILTAYQQLNKTLNQKKLSFDLIEIYQSVQQHLYSLVNLERLQQVPITWLKRYPMYLDAMQKRLEKAPRAGAQDREYRQDIERLERQLAQALQSKGIIEADERVVLIRWLFEELWLSWYAQQHKTVETVSVKRLSKIISSI